MLLSIHHTTQYRYSQPALRVTQALRLWPAACAGQRVNKWQVEIDGKRLASTTSDGYGNPCATHTADGPVNGVRIDVRGQVETEDLHGVLGEGVEMLPTAFFRFETPLTCSDAAIRELADQARGEDSELACLHRLCNLVRDRVDYVAKQTNAETTAIEALSRGVGVCQDHAHLLIAAARAIGYPARYVSGYLCAGGAVEEAASHAWAEIHVSDLGWVGFDAANRMCPDDHYVRIASGRDYRDAAPVRGIHQGGMSETLEVSVQVQSAQQ
jgi:transglutaminase-like putative cysteine protease